MCYWVQDHFLCGHYSDIIYTAELCERYHLVVEEKVTKRRWLQPTPCPEWEQKQADWSPVEVGRKCGHCIDEAAKAFHISDRSASKNPDPQLTEGGNDLTK